MFLKVLEISQPKIRQPIFLKKLHIKHVEKNIQCMRWTETAFLFLRWVSLAKKRCGDKVSARQADKRVEVATKLMTAKTHTGKNTTKFFKNDDIKKSQTITTIEIAEMMDTEHWKVLRKLDGRTGKNGERERGYVEILTDNHLVASDYFVSDTYRDSSGKENKCYKVTRLGCDFLANKFTGEKGILFTAKYVKRFNDMEQGNVPKDFPSALRAYADELERRQIVEQEKEKLQIELDSSKDWYSIKRVAALNGVDWKIFDWRKLKSAGIDMGHEVKKNFDANYGEVNTYHKDVWENVYPEYEI